MRIELSRKSNSHSEYNKYIATTRKGKQIPIYARNSTNAYYKAMFGLVINLINPTIAAFLVIIYFGIATHLFKDNGIVFASSIIVPAIAVRILSKFL
tara:strand:- start:76 stop:366 length:291 start_codon:yes stop_codon:yes gene_type:complete